MLTYLALLATKGAKAAKDPIQLLVQAKDAKLQPEFPFAPLKKRQLDKFEYDL